MSKPRLAKIGALLVLVAGIAAGTAAVGMQKTPDARPKTKTAANIMMRPIPTAMAQAVENASVHLFPGEVRATRRVELAFSVPGLLRQLDAREGSRVTKGQIIARLDQRDFKYAYDAAKAECTFAKRDLDRFSSLWTQNVVSAGDYENAKADYDIARAKMQLKKKALADTVLYAPFNGVVVRRHVEDHEHIKAKQPILSLQDISTIEVLVQIPERILARRGVEGLADLLVHFDAEASPQSWHTGKVREYSAESDAVTRTYEMVVTLPPPSNLKIYPGMTATVKVRIPTQSPISGATPAAFSPAATRIPIEALWCGEDGESYVWIIAPEGGTPHRQKVDATSLSDSHVVIRAGLRPGTHVAVAGVHSLREDQPVRPLKQGKEGLDG